MWPTPQDYNEAIQHPAQNLSDNELRGGVVENNSLGLPKPRSGAFASVYRMHANNKDWAVKCFLNNQPDLHERYRKISQFIQHHPLRYTVDFEYEPEGILVGGQWYPILKMAWVEGVGLLEYITTNLERAYKLELLASSFKQMIWEMEDAGIAHGDLQHGNIIVVGDKKIALVDYDGMFVPPLAGRQANEIGHRNYQHPHRTAQYFDSHLDHFSSWVIYASLRILSKDASIWDAIPHDGESLLFKDADFRLPNESVVLNYLGEHECGAVRNLAKRVHANCLLKFDAVCRLQKDDEAQFEMPEAYEPMTISTAVKARLANQIGGGDSHRGGGTATLLGNKEPHIELVEDPDTQSHSHHSNPQHSTASGGNQNKWWINQTVQSGPTSNASASTPATSQRLQPPAKQMLSRAALNAKGAGIIVFLIFAIGAMAGAPHSHHSFVKTEELHIGQSDFYLNDTNRKKAFEQSLSQADHEYAARDYSGAIAHYGIALRAGQVPPMTYDEVRPSSLYLKIAKTYTKQGNYELAKKFFDESMAYCPQHSEGYANTCYEYALCYFYSSQPKHAVPLLNTAVDIYKALPPSAANTKALNECVELRKTCIMPKLNDY